MKNIIENQLRLEDGTVIRATLDSSLDICIERNGQRKFTLTVKDYLRANLNKLTEEEVAFLACFDAYMDHYNRIQERGESLINELFKNQLN